MKCKKCNITKNRLPELKKELEEGLCLFGFLLFIAAMSLIGIYGTTYIGKTFLIIFFIGLAIFIYAPIPEMWEMWRYKKKKQNT